MLKYKENISRLIWYMDFQDAFARVDAAMVTVAGRHLKDAEKNVLQGSWGGLTYEQMTEKSEFTVNYLRGDIGPKLWKHLSRAFEEEVTKTNIRAVLERQKLLPPQPRRSFAQVPDISEFYGRTAELKQLQQWVTEDKVRLITLFGIAGIGKTSLAVKLVNEIKGEFDEVIWKSLSTSPPLPELIADIIQLSPDSLKENPLTPQAGLAQLLEHLRSHRCLLILDNLEILFQYDSTAGRYREGYESYHELLGQVGEEGHNSCLIVCSREVPTQVQSLANSNPSVCSLEVKRLEFEDIQAFLQQKGLTGQEEWEDFANNLERHPLAIKIASAIAEKLFDKDIAKYIKMCPTTFKELDEIFDYQFKTLSQVEKDIFFCLAKQDQPISIFEMKTNVSPSPSSSDFINGIESLIGKCLVEKEFNREKGISVFSLHSLVKKFVRKNHPNFN